MAFYSEFFDPKYQGYCIVHMETKNNHMQNNLNAEVENVNKFKAKYKQSRKGNK